MKIAVISDVHANFPALEAVLKDAKARGAQEIWDLGDSVGYSPSPNECLSHMRRAKVKGILGNYDQKALDFPKTKKEWKKQKDPSKYFSFEWTSQHLSWLHKRYLRKLPEKLEMKKEGIRFLLVHGSPRAMDEGLGEKTPSQRFLELAKMVQVDVVLCGHSHCYFDKEISGVRFINPGSVGRPFDKDPRASYVMLEINPFDAPRPKGQGLLRVAVRLLLTVLRNRRNTERSRSINNGVLRLENYRIDYDIDKNLKKMEKEKFPSNLIDSIRLGRSLDDLKPGTNQGEEERILSEVLKLAEICRYDKAHAEQVLKLSLMLFDELKVLHGLGAQERFLLKCGALLHDIGWIKGGSGHHKAARDIILESTALPFSPEQKVIIALLARYHRRSLPCEKHKLYNELTPPNKKIVNSLASLLRIADGLDATHGAFVKDIKCKTGASEVTASIVANEFPQTDLESSQEKSDLFEQFFGKKFLIEHKV